MKKQILVLGEFLSARDDLGPFTDGNGKFFKVLLRQAGINPRECVFKNVLNLVPSRGFNSIVGPKAEGIKDMKPVTTKYVKAQYEPHVRKLWEWINELQPRIIIAVGDLAVWATTSEKSIKNSRGRVTPAHSGLPGLKVVPTYHPRTVQAEYAMRNVVVFDLMKAKRESEFAGLRRKSRLIHIAETINDLEDYHNEHIASCTHLSVDIEVKGYKEKAHSIACIGFAPSPASALVIPFFTEEQPDGNYWRTEREELLAWAFIRRTLKAGKRVGGQNYQYDMQYMWRLVGIKNSDFSWDTMLMHHALQPEMEKSLGFLASLYTDEPSWKQMHKASSSDKSQKKGE